jgi:hypothetical protein
MLVIIIYSQPTLSRENQPTRSESSNYMAYLFREFTNFPKVILTT